MQLYCITLSESIRCILLTKGSPKYKKAQKLDNLQERILEHNLVLEDMRAK